jgi:methyltransferase (TIGR00027 family)
MAKRRIDTRESRTAEFTCLARAFAGREKEARFRGPDHLAEILIPPIPRLVVILPPLRRFFIKKFIAPGIYEYVLARTKIMDSEFIHALETDFPQIVLLGAGFDTRALRFADLNQGTRIFELDIETTQQPKIGVLLQKKIKIPEELRFVPIDFDKESLFKALSEAGYQEKQKSLFLWEGVSMYLSAQAVDETLGFIRTCSASGSRIAFDYIFASVLRQEGDLYGEREAYNMVSKVGEGWTFGIEAGEIERFLAVRGFEIVAHYAPAELERIYLTAENGYRYGRVNGTHCIVIASVN